MTDTILVEIPVLLAREAVQWLADQSVADCFADRGGLISITTLIDDALQARITDPKVAS